MVGHLSDGVMERVSLILPTAEASGRIALLETTSNVVANKRFRGGGE